MMTRRHSQPWRLLRPVGRMLGDGREVGRRIDGKAWLPPVPALSSSATVSARRQASGSSDVRTRSKPERSWFHVPVETGAGMCLDGGAHVFLEVLRTPVAVQ